MEFYFITLYVYLEGQDVSRIFKRLLITLSYRKISLALLFTSEKTSDDGYNYICTNCETCFLSPRLILYIIKLHCIVLVHCLIYQPIKYIYYDHLIERTLDVFVHFGKCGNSPYSI